MKKLRLELDELNVESFETAEADGQRGTVDAHVSRQCTGGPYTCNGGNSCGEGETCADFPTCAYVSCNGSCPLPCTYEESYCFNNTCFDCSFPGC